MRSLTAPLACGDCPPQDGELEAIRMLIDRRDELSHQRIQTLNRLHRLLTELIPGWREEGPVRVAGQDPAGWGAPA